MTTSLPVPFRINQNNMNTIYVEIQKNYSDFLELILKSDIGKMFLNFSKTLRYIPAFKCIRIDQYLQILNMQVLIAYEITFIDDFKILFGYTMASNRSIVYYCFCSLNNDIKIFVKESATSFSAKYINGMIVYLDKDSITIRNSNKMYKLEASIGTRGEQKYNFKEIN